MVHGDFASLELRKQNQLWKSLMEQVFVGARVLEAIFFSSLYRVAKGLDNSLGSLETIENLHIIHMIINYFRAKKVLNHEQILKITLKEACLKNQCLGVRKWLSW